MPAALVARGEGSLVACSLYGEDDDAAADAAIEPRSTWRPCMAACARDQRRTVAALHTGHGNVMPQSLHGGPARRRRRGAGRPARALNFRSPARRRSRPAPPCWIAADPADAVCRLIQETRQSDPTDLPVAAPARTNFARHLLALNAGRPDKAAFVDDLRHPQLPRLDERVRRLAAACARWASSGKSACCC